MDNVPPHSIISGNPAVVIDNDWAQIGAAAIQIIIGNRKYSNKLHQLILMDIYSLILAGVLIYFATREK